MEMEKNVPLEGFSGLYSQNGKLHNEYVLKRSFLKPRDDLMAKDLNIQNIIHFQIPSLMTH